MKAIAPARIDLAGGTLDVPPLCFLIENALTLNVAIDLKVEINLEPSSQWRLFPRGKDQPWTALPLLFEITRQYLRVSRPYDIFVASDIPRSSGLGGSSSLLVALVNAFLACGEATPPKASLLELVTVLEHRLLGKPAGTQDAIAAIYGGLSVISFDSGKPCREVLALPDFLENDMIMAYSSVQHHSGLNNWGIIKAACDGDQATLRKLQGLSDNAHLILAALKAEDNTAFLNGLIREAELRRTLAEGLMTPEMQAFSDRLPDGTVAKICGAGGGGCLYLFGALPDSDALGELALGHNLEILRVQPALSPCQSYS